MNLTVTINTSGLNRKLDLIVAKAKDLEPALRELDKFKRGRLKDGDAVAGLAPLAKSTTERLQHTRKSAITAAGKIRASALAKTKSGLLSYLAYATNSKNATKTAYAKDMLASLSHLVRNQGNSDLLHGLVLSAEGRAVKRLAKGLEKYQTQTPAQRSGGKKVAGQHAENRRLLGRLPDAIKSTITKGTLTIANLVSWARVQQEGGSVGNGANLPARKFFYWDEADFEYFRIAVRQWLIQGV